MSFGQQLFRYLRNIIRGSGKRRIVCSIVNIALIAIAALCVWGLFRSLDIMNSTSFIGGLLLFIVCIVCGIAFVINGIVGQIILLVCAFIGLFNAEERKCNAVAFVIALLSFVGATVTIILLV